MAKSAWAWVAAGVAAASLAFAADSRYGAWRRQSDRLTRETALLAASIERLERAPAPERVVEYHTTRETTAVAEPPAPVAGDAQSPDSPGAFDRNDVRDYVNGRAPHPIGRRFERERPESEGEVGRRQRALEATLARALDGLDLDIHSAECRAATCRVEATFGSLEASSHFIDRAFGPAAEGAPMFEHGGVYVPVHEQVGERFHDVLYVMKAPPAQDP